jgi:hypothetical protein
VDLLLPSKKKGEEHSINQALESAREPEEKPQIPPLRCAPVGMTILWDHSQPFVDRFATISVQQNCHPDRSAAQWRDLRFLFRFSRRH